MDKGGYVAKTGMIGAAVVFGLTSSPGAAYAHQECNDGENSGASVVIASNGTYYNNKHAWRYYTRLSDGQIIYRSRLTAQSEDGILIYDQFFNEFAGKWDSGSFSEVSHGTSTTNYTGATRTYFYKRSCTK